MQTSLRLLGEAAVQAGEGGQKLTLDRPVSLLVYLALRGDWVSRAELALLYRPDATDAVAAAYLRKLVFRARQFPWAQQLEVEQGSLRWLVESDVAQFRAAAAARDWPTALELWRGPLLGDQQMDSVPGFSSWLAQERQVLQTSWLQAAVNQAAEHSRRGETGPAAQLLQQVVASDPLAEENVQACMRALAADGREREALAVYERFRLELETELADQPLETTQALADSLQSRLQQTTVGTPRARKLPEPTTSFIGREQELRQLQELLGREEVRLVTVVGLGGSGKTRLALEAARRSQVSWRDGAAFISLAGLHELELIVQAIADGLGVVPDGDDAAQTLISELSGRELLLVLDDVEAEAPAAAWLSQLLQDAAGVSVLLTAREALQLSGEWLFEPGGLVTPETGSDLDPARSDAVQLFIQRAARVRPDLVFSDSELTIIGDICRQVEGLPLAIELAASWLRLLPVAELQEQLLAQTELLTTQLHDVPERHRSVWRVFDHSWQRLSPAQQTALTSLTVFSDSFSLEAARAVAGADLELLLGLVSRALVRRRTAGRFALHSLIRQYAAMHGTAEVISVARAAHLEYFTQLLERLTPDLQGGDILAGLTAVQADLANIEAAWELAVQQLDLDALAAARQPLDHYFYYRARFTAGARLFGRAAEALAADPQPAAQRLRGLMLRHQADRERWHGRLQPAQTLLNEALQLLHDFGDETDLAYARQSQATLSLALGEYAAAREHLQAVLAVAESHDVTYLKGSASNGLAMLASNEGDLQTAEEFYHASLQAHRQIGNVEGITGALVNLGACRFELDDFSEAERLWTDAVEQCSRIGYWQRQAAILNNLGSLAEVRGDDETALARFARSLELRREIGDQAGIARVLPNLGRLQQRQGNFAEARVLFQEALERSQAVGETEAVIHSRNMLARSLVSLGRLQDARVQVAAALELALETDAVRDSLGVLHSTALLYEQQGQTDAAMAIASFVARAAAGNLEAVRREAAALAERLAGGAETSGNESDGSSPEAIVRFGRSVLNRLQQPARA